MYIVAISHVEIDSNLVLCLIMVVLNPLLVPQSRTQEALQMQSHRATCLSLYK